MRTQLLNHNKSAYEKVIKAFKTTNRTCVVHPTGTGKSYLIAAVSENYKNVLILGPNVFVLDQVRDVIQWRNNGIEFMTYQMLSFMDETPTGYDLICLDEFHRAGAPGWGERVIKLLRSNPNAKVFGTTATPIRYLDKARDMSDEIFQHNVASHMTIGEAWSRSILPIPTFVTGLFNFHNIVIDAEERINKSKKLSHEEKRKRLFKLSNARLGWEKSMGMPAILRRHLDPQIKRIIVFCANIERLEAMRSTVIGWFKTAGFTVASSCTVHIGQSDKQLREAMEEFQSDEGDGVRLMFSVNMLNEGVHIPRVGAVLMLRTTLSRIIYMQQIGRCLTAANTERPVILDMVDNITTTSAIHGLLDDFEGWQMIMKSEMPDYVERRFNIVDYKQSLRDILKKISPLELSFETYEEKLQQLIAFCEEHGRTPRRQEGAIFIKYMYLITNFRDTDEVKAIIQKYAQTIFWNENNREFMEKELREFIDTHHRGPSRWIAEDLRWYKMRIAFKKHEPEHPLLLEMNRLEAEILAAEQEKWYSEAIAIINDFVNTNGRLPKSTALPDGTYEPIQKWRSLKKKYSDRDEVKAIMAKYGGGRKHKLIPLEVRIKMCEDFSKQHGFVPHACFADSIIVNSWKYLKRSHADNPRVKALMEYPALNSNYGRIEQGIKKVEEFYAKYGRLPGNSKYASEEEKKARNSMENIFAKYADNPRVKVLMAKRVRFARLESSIQRIVSFEKKHGRIPNCTPAEINDHTVWKLLVKDHADEPEVAQLIKRHPEDSEEGRRIVNRQNRFKKHLDRLTAFYESEGRFPIASTSKPKAERQAYSSMLLLRNDFSDEPEVKSLLDKKSNISIILQDGIKLLHDFVNKTNRLPRDNQSTSKEERRALATWKTLKNKYPDLPVTRKLMQLYPFGTDKLGRAIQEVVEFESKWQRLPRKTKGGIDGESKAYEKFCALRKLHSDHPTVKALLDKYKDYDPRMEITRESIAKVKKWADEHGRLPKYTKTDKEERNMAYMLKYIRRRHSDMNEVKLLLAKYQKSRNNDVEDIAC